MKKPNTKGLCVRIHTGKCLSGTEKVKARKGLVCRRCHADFERRYAEAAARQPRTIKYGAMSIRDDVDLAAVEKYLTECEPVH